MLSKISFIYFIIFVFLFFVPFVICDENKICNSVIANNRYDCLKLSSSNNHCCFKSVGENCREFEDLSNINDYDCGIVKGSVGEYEFSIYHPIPSDDIGIGFQTCGAKKSKKKKIVPIILN